MKQTEWKGSRLKAQAEDEALAIKLQEEEEKGLKKKEGW